MLYWLVKLKAIDKGIRFSKKFARSILIFRANFKKVDRLYLNNALGFNQNRTTKWILKIQKP